MSKRKPVSHETFGLAELLGGCRATLSGWHVPEVGRRIILSKEPHPALWLGLAYMEAYELAPQGGRPRCLCGWRPSEDVILALQELTDVLFPPREKAKKPRLVA